MSEYKIKIVNTTDQAIFSNEFKVAMEESWTPHGDTKILATDTGLRFIQIFLKKEQQRKAPVSFSRG